MSRTNPPATEEDGVGKCIDVVGAYNEVDSVVSSKIMRDGEQIRVSVAGATCDGTPPGENVPILHNEVDDHHLYKSVPRQEVANDYDTVSESPSSLEDDEGDLREPAVGIITVQVASDKKSAYEEWQSRIFKVARQQKGFINIDSTWFELEDGSFGISVLLKFDSSKDLQAWQSSQERLNLISEGYQRSLFLTKSDMERKDDEIPFVEYMRFETGCGAVKALPPPKWKLWFVIYLCVLTSNLATNEANASHFFQRGGHLSFETALFVRLLTTVTFIVYAYSPALQSISVFGYGLDAWLKLPRYSIDLDPKNYFFNTNVVFDAFIRTAENGFAMFNPPPVAPSPPDLVNAISRLEGRLESLKRHMDYRINFVDERTSFNTQQYGRHHPSVDKPSNSRPNDDHHNRKKSSLSIRRTSSNASLKVRLMSATEEVLRDVVEAAKSVTEDVDIEAQSSGALKVKASTPIAVTIHHRVRWETTEEYRRWQIAIVQAMSKKPGFISSQFIIPRRDHVGVQSDDLYTTVLKFDTVENLQNWMLSDERMEFLYELQPLIVAYNEVSARTDRVLPDAFTDQMVGQGVAAAPLPPPKIKVVVLTSMSLFLVAWPLAVGMPDVYTRWGVLDPHARTAISAIFTTLLNMYVAAPIFSNMFGHWLLVPQPSYFEVQPWRLMVRGFSWRISMFAVVFLFFGSCITKILVDDDNE